MQYRKLGETDISISAIAMGCWALAGDATWGPQDMAESVATVHAALDAGVNLFDTAEGYGGGDSESALGQALLGRRHEAVIATKVSRANLSRDEVRRACEKSLERLRTDYVDLYQIHWPSRTVPLSETMEALEQLREQGKVRAVGVCNFGLQDLSDLTEIPSRGLAMSWVETNQLPYSLLWRAVEFELRQRCVDEGIGILCYSALAQGLLTGKFLSAQDVPDGRARTRLFSGERPEARHGQAGCEAEVFAAINQIRHICDEIHEPMANVALVWLLHQPGVTSAIAGARRPDQIRQTVQAADLVLAPDILTRLADATEEIKRIIGPNPDMWQSPSRFR
ncbi:MAG: aldo/keto reductase [Anaerolineae bacterium]|nr:aldo/keto reductase [Anaerolineae bacterium]